MGVAGSVSRCQRAGGTIAGKAGGHHGPFWGMVADKQGLTTSQGLDGGRGLHRPPRNERGSWGAGRESLPSNTTLTSTSLDGIDQIRPPRTLFLPHCTGLQRR